MPSAIRQIAFVRLRFTWRQIDWFCQNKRRRRANPAGGGGWVEAIDNAKKGVIFRYQDYTHFWRDDMCGDQGWAIVRVNDFTTIRPVITQATYHHNWTSGKIRVSAFEVGAESGGKATVRLKVDYVDIPKLWQRADQVLTY